MHDNIPHTIDIDDLEDINPNVDKLGALKRKAQKIRLKELFDLYTEHGARYETHFFKEVTSFAKSKMIYLEGKPAGFSRVGTANTVDDFAQEVTIAVWQGLSGFRGNSSVFFSWLYIICNNKRADFFNELLEQKKIKVGLTVAGTDDYDGETEI